MNVNLVIFREDGSRRVFPLKPGATTIGRKNDCEIRIPLAVVSRHHAEVVLSDHDVLVRDLAGANGTFLNNQRVKEEELEPGDQIMVGPVVFTVQIDGEPSDEQLVEVRTKVSATVTDGGIRGVRVGTSNHVASSDDEIDPIAALEALASSADQTAITPELDEE